MSARLELLLRITQNLFSLRPQLFMYKLKTKVARLVVRRRGLQLMLFASCYDNCTDCLGERCAHLV